jgi:hypothetical protein
MTQKRKRPDPKNKRFAPPPNVRTMDDILRAAAKTPPKPRKVSPLQRFKQIKW